MQNSADPEQTALAILIRICTVSHSTQYIVKHIEKKKKKMEWSV